MHCSACSYEGSDRSLNKHQNETKHEGICEGSWERVVKQSSYFFSQDTQFICWKCGQHCLKAYISYR